MSKIVVIHHNADFDGVFSREIAHQHFGDSAEYIGWDYGDAVPEIAATDSLYMIDISIDALMDHPGLTWIDHHKTAIDKYSDIVNDFYCIDGVAACRLAWQFFNNDGNLPGKESYINREVSEPLAVRLAGEFDVWDKRDPSADIFQYGLKCGLLDDTWKWILDTGDYGKYLVGQILERGETAQEYATTVNAEIMTAYSFSIDFEGLHLLALNTARCNSLTFESAIDPEHDGLIGFRYDGKKWTVSLYGVPHKPDIDLSQIASKYGGGGHKQACGFQCNKLPF